MNIEEYLKILTDQIRCKKARPAVCEEIRGHIEDQKSAFMEEGLNETEAEAAAVREMGDPVDTGVSLDRVHRPCMAWGMIALIAALSLTGFVLQYLQRMNYMEGTHLASYTFTHLTLMLAGLGMMIGICFIDYSRIGYYAKELFLLLLAVLAFGLVFLAQEVNGQINWIMLGSFSINTKLMVFLFVPLYGAILYSYRGQGWSAVIKGILWMLPCLLLAFSIPNMSSLYLLFLTFSVTLSVAVYKNWFRVSRKLTLTAIWLFHFLLPLSGGLYILFFTDGYRKMRIQSMISPPWNSESYQALMLWKIIENSQIIGTSKTIENSWHNLPESTDFALSYVLARYGILASVLLSAVILYLFLRLIHTSQSQRNQLGMIMGIGCSVLFILQICFYILENLGYPFLGTYCPFLSYGGSGMLVTYILLGILLSIYRYQNVLPEMPCTKTKNKKLFYRKIIS